MRQPGGKTPKIQQGWVRNVPLPCSTLWLQDYPFVSLSMCLSGCMTRYDPHLSHDCQLLRRLAFMFLTTDGCGGNVTILPVSSIHLNTCLWLASAHLSLYFALCPSGRWAPIWLLLFYSLTSSIHLPITSFHSSLFPPHGTHANARTAHTRKQPHSVSLWMSLLSILWPESWRRLQITLPLLFPWP